MMMQLLTGMAVWMTAAFAVGLILGKVMCGYGVGYLPVPVPVREAGEEPPYRRAA